MKYIRPMSTRYRLTISLILTTLLAGGSATAGVVINGSVFGGGNEADVQTNTTVNISAGQVKGNVYGGGNLGDVGKINDKSDPSNYTWTDNTGVSKVNITGGLIGDTTTSNNITANVFGGGKGNEESFYCEKGMVYSTKVRITKGAVNGDVYGGGQIARVESNTIVTIGSETGDSVADIKGNVFGAGAGLETHGYSALVRGNPVVTIQGNAKVAQDVYGGGKIASVGRHKVKTSNSPLTPADAPADLPVGMPYTLQNTNLGICTVDIKGSAEIAGNVFGAGQGLDPVYDSEDKPTRMAMGNITETFDTEEAYFVFLQTMALTTETDVTISGNATVKGSVYGGSKSGFVQYHTDVKILGGTIGETDSDEGNIYGGGRGVDGSEFAGRVSGNTKVTIGGGTTYGDVYGGGAYSIVKQNVVVNVDGGEVKKDVYGGGALANTNTANWNPDADNYSLVNGLNVGTSSVAGLYTRSGDIYTLVTGDNPTAADETDYYSRGSWADNTNKSALYTTRVVLTGGTVTNVYGGALGDDDHRAKVYGDIAIYLNGIEDADYNSTDYGSLSTAIGSDHMLPTSSTGAIVNKLFGANNLYGTPMGHVKVHVFATQNKDNDKPTIIDKFVKENTDVTTILSLAKLKGYLLDDIKLATELGITTTDYQEVYDDASADADAIKTAITDLTTAINNRIEANPDTEEAKIDAVRYDVQAVYGGGNLSAYVPFETNETTEVIIDGCDYTSIRQVYGGGNAASVSSSHVIVNGTYEINDVFGGGNGNDPYTLGDKHYLNPGANVGYYNYTHWGNQTGTEDNPIQPIDNDDALTKDDRIANYRYGAGIAKTEILGGTIHSVFGGSNQKGNISNTAISIYDDLDDDCPVTVDETYGGGKNAPMDGQIKLDLDCVKNMPMIFGGAKNADIYSDIVLNITNGSFNKVFGGNNEGGAIYGSITVNVEEKGCQPIEIGELYGGGYLAPYSIYGYEKDADGNYKYYKVDGNNQFITDNNGNYVEWTTSDGNVPRKLMPLVEIGTDPADPYNQPHINIISATRIGKVFGGGYKAMMVGNPHVNVNMKEGKILKEFIEGDDDQILPIGTIDTVYGGGYMATVIGSTYVEIGTGQWYIEDEKTQTEDASGVIYTYNSTTGKWDYIDDDETKSVDNKPAPGRNTAKITGSVYGGGDQADITENTFVIIGASKEPDNSYASVAPGSGVITIGGNVFGGGKGLDDTFTCEKAMVGVDGDGAIDEDHDGEPDNPDGGTTVIIGNGTVNGTVYGGGEIGRVEKNTMVMIGIGPGVASGTPSSAPEIKGDVFGAGKGVKTHGYSALVRGNPTVTIQGNAKVRGNVYGGGEIASVARYTVVNANPVALENTWSGNCIVTIQGYAEIGPEEAMLMNNTTTHKPDDKGHVFGAGKGIVPEVYSYADNDHKPKRMISGNGWQYFADDTEYHTFIETLALATYTHVTISGNAFVKGSVYGGSENGIVQDSTHVTIEGNCQIGQGKNAAGRHPSTVWESSYVPSNLNDLECNSWEYDASSGAPYDKFASSTGTYDYSGEYSVIAANKRRTSSEGGRTVAKDGHTYYGNVFGGGRGVEPYAPGLWRNNAGAVRGNTNVYITGGHILTNVYGGNELTNVEGKSTVKFGGTATLGVPRTLEQITAHPVTCYLFGAGKGDQREIFYQETNVNEVEVVITGGKIYGSVFGGAEDGHVLGDVSMTISDNAYIGTIGTSYLDGNVFGGGRGFSGENQTSGNVNGNIDVNIEGGTMLGSIYGGGRLASVGTWLTSSDDPNFGNLQEDDDNNTYGHITIDISGGTIGKEFSIPVPEGAKYSGNVFGGSMGRLTLLDGNTNPNWPKMAQAKVTEVNISGNSTTIYRNVYGGGELGTVRDSASVNISGGEIKGSVYGGGYGSRNDSIHTIFTVKEPNTENPSTPADYDDNTYAFSPMQFAGCVGRNTHVNISGGYVIMNVYGGGEMASVGIMNCLVDSTTTEPSADKIVVGTRGGKYYYYKNMNRHSDVTREFALSWPYEFNYMTGFDGATHVNITGGRIGALDEDNPLTDNGDVYGGGKGFAGDYKDYVFCANVGSADLYINFSTELTPQNFEANNGNCITGAVYGGGENGHVMGDTKVTFENGLIGHALYGGGSGKDKFNTRLLKIGANPESTLSSDSITRQVFSITAGKVFGNTTVDMKGGHVLRNVYGGGTYASIGKGNYAGGTDDYSTGGYGEKLVTSLWAGDDDNKFRTAFLNSGKCTVRITGGTVGYNTSDSKDGLPYGNVFGGCRGIAAPNVDESPLYLYCPEFFMGYANETEVIIGTEGSSSGPTILGSVYGGGQDGHVRRDASVTVYSGVIGKEYTSANQTAVGTSELSHLQWLHAGNVYGAGSGIGKYQYDFNNNGHTSTDANGNGIIEDNEIEQSTYKEETVKEEDYSNSAGSVTRFTKVEIKGGTIHRNVYGGGSLASVGAPKLDQTYNEYIKDDPDHKTEVGKQTLNLVIISGGQIGDESSYNTTTGAHVYGGMVYGGSRGSASLDDTFSTALYDSVIISDNAIIKGDVFGGGESGIVKGGVNVTLNGGTIEHDVYGGGALAQTNTLYDASDDEKKKYTTTVNLGNSTAGATVNGNLYGGGLGEKISLGGTTDIPANVNGPVTVTVLNGKAANVYGCNNIYGAPQKAVRVKINGTDTPVSPQTYAIGNVYGGGNLAAYSYTDSILKVVMTAGYVNNIFGGGNLADVAGSIDVTISGGTVVNDVYGGGALANTNTANWDTGTGTWAAGMIDGTTGTTYKTTVNLNGGIIGNAYGGALGQLSAGVHYTQEEIDDAEEGDDAYGKTTADWKVEPAADGVGAVKAMVYGDVTVTVDGAALPAVLDRIDYDADDKPINILKGGRVFGCNNINGTPKGKVQVNVTSTSNALSTKQTKSTSKTLSERYHYYYDDGDQIDVAAVYGGGNASDYEPHTNQAPKVTIDGCGTVSIGSVYGGGNAAAVPATDVDIEGSYYIGYVFGGGFGAGDDNRGANVGYKSFPLNNPPTGDARTPYLYGNGTEIGNALVTIKGGYIDNVFGASDTKGDVSGTVSTSISEVSNGCDLKIGSLYGGGRRATVDHDITTQIDCPSNSISAVYGGSEMADIHGNVTLTITAGTFDEVYGGNRKSGVIDGYITVNLEETEIGCRPIIITNLYGGCDDAPYSGAANSDGHNVIVNAKAFTSIGNLYGGSRGINATLTGNTLVNINQTKGFWADSTVNNIHIPDSIGKIGNIYGGGDQAKVIGYTVVNIGTETTVGFINEPTHLSEHIDPATDGLYYVPVLGAKITGDVYGGGNKANVTDNTYVYIGAIKSEILDENDDPTGLYNYLPVDLQTSAGNAYEGVTIGGNVYGGGKGVADNYECDKAMVGIVNEGTGSTYVYIGNGTVGTLLNNGILKDSTGNVFGGGMVGRVEADTHVTIGFGDDNTSISSPVILGSVFGAGQGLATHGYSGLVRGNSTVAVQGKAKILGSVYGGGQKASVGRFYVKNVNDGDYEYKNNYNVPTGMPYAPISGGTCSVTIKGYAEIGRDSMVMTAVGGPDDAGHVFGAGKGLIPYLDTDTEEGTGVGQGVGRYYKPDGVTYTWQSYNDNESAYLEYIETLALASFTDVTITGHAFIKGSVYGGSENGRVLDSTYVKIQENCQIGNGYVQMADNGTYLPKPLSMDRPYSKEEWTEGHLITTNDRPALQALAANYYTSSLPECASWPYQAPYATYDQYAIYQNSEGKYYYDADFTDTLYAEGGSVNGSDGHTFYGNVFGGGSGYYPYKNSNGQIKWHKEAGAVGGNTRVEVTGGHILTNLYGGNEMTNVGKGVADTEGGTCTIIFSDSATLGVPRTLGQIDHHPVTCYLFGAGKGDQRVLFNKQTNVNEVNITITGGWIYGSLFGGGEDGHVMRDVTITIDTTATTAPKIGTWGTSYVDGNVFGGGRGFAGNAYTAGNVGGSIDLKIKGGQMLGSIYGGGRLGSVGYGLYDVNEKKDDHGHPLYGGMRPDDEFDHEEDGNNATAVFTHGRGHVNIEISGGTIGNDYEYITPDEVVATAKANMPNTTHDANNKLLHTKGGNVYAGGMGRHDRLDGTPITQSETDIDWKKLGNVKSTKLTISGKARIKSNVYGGGEFGAVKGYHTDNANKQWGAEVIITGGEIGTTIGTGDDQYQFGSVFGGGMGHNIYQGGDVENNDSVYIKDAIVHNSVYGGGEVGSVGTITNFATLDSIDGSGNYLYKHDDYKEEASAAHSEGAFYKFGLSWPYEFIYDKSTGLASVTITGSTQIGGYVFGAAKGSVDVGTNDIIQQRFIEAKIANVRETRITIGSASGTQPTISRSVYGGGEDGHVYENTIIVINGGEIAHSVFGGGKGEGVYSDTLLDNTVDPEHWRLKADAELIHSWTAGKVYGNTYVTMNGGSVGYNLYGGGNLASVGKGNYAGGYDDYSIVGYGELPENEQNSKLWETSEGFDPDDPNTFTKLADYFMGSGRTYVNINSGTIGSAASYEEDENGNKFPYGNVFGSSRGKAALNVGQLSPRYRYTPDFFLGYTNETHVTIGNDTVLIAPRIYGSVYGGGQDGHVRRHTNVVINKGEIGVPYSSTDVVIKDRGNVYGAGSGMGQYDTGKKDSGNNPILAYNNSSGSVTCTTNITIKGGTIYQNVYGGGAMASVGPPNAGQLFDEYNDTTSYTIPYIPGVTSTHANVEKHASVSYTEVNIKGGQIGSSTDFSDNNYGGNVYGASRGGDYAAAILKYNEDPNTYTTVLWPTVNVAGGAIAGNVFGGGEMGMVKCGVNVNITGGTIGNDVYGGGALAHTNTSNWDYTRAGVVNNVWKTGSWGKDWAKGKITLSGKRTTTYNTKVNILGGTIGSATSGGDVYGGGLGQLGADPVEAIVYGDVFVNLNGLDKNDFKNNQIPDSLSRIVPPAPGSEHEYRIATNAKGAIVNRIFGANNLNGSPRGHIKVHVFATQNRDANKDSIHAKYAKHPIQGEEGHEDETLSQYLHRIDTTYTTLKATPAVRSAIEAAVSANNTYNTTQNDENKTALDNAIALMDTALFKLYDVQAVYGGGNLAEYVWCKRDTIINKNQTELVDAARTEVIIDGCDYSSIRQVYGGGNAASAPGTFVEVNGSYEIYELFGGGNGAEDYELDGVWYDNPGANVGYHNYTYVVKIGENGYNASTHGTGSVNTPYLAIDNSDADTPENRRAHYAYGSGIATTDIHGGTIHYVFGGSNKKGNISTTALSVYSESDDDCPIDIHETYGGGKDAPIDGDIELTLDCVKDMDMIFGGSKNADVNSNITLNITNGRFNKVFGGNNTSGAISGSITVNVEESGCVPIEINELYGGGYLAPYSIYGYEKDEYGNYVTEPVTYIDDDNVERSLDQRKPLTSGATHNNDPRINIISATRIGTVYGGGYQAKVVGSPYVNVNMTNGRVEVKNTAASGNPEVYKDGHDTIYTDVFADTIRESGSGAIKEIKHYAPLEIGTIDTIYGGGNLASIIGDTHVEIGTGRWVTSWDSIGNPIYETVDVNGVKYIYKVDTLAVTYSDQECAANNDTIPGAITEETVLTAEQATRLNELLSKSYSAGSSPNLADAKKYNETLDGYITNADVKKPAVWAWYDKDTVKLDVQAQPTPARYAANITGDVFGGGKGKADNFTCDKAMIGDAVDLPNPAERNGGTNVIIANGTVGGSVYGGGMIARVEKNTAVTIGFESGIGEPIIGKDVFGAGMGAPTHGYAGLVRGNSSVIIQGNSKVKGSVYGGGMQASLGRYFVATSQALATLHKVKVGMPYDLKNGGKATVIVRGNAEIGPDTLLMTAPGGPQNTGHVFGAGKGTRPYESTPVGRYYMNGSEYTWQSYSDDEDAYIEYIETLGITNETEVTIGGNAFIKGSVYGGSESGFVLKNTHVTIQDNCQIGNGLVQMADDGTYLDNPLNMNRPYSAQEWAEGHLIMTAADSLNVNLIALVGNNYSEGSLPECSSWPYKAPYAPYDRFADANGRYPEGSIDTTARGGRPTGSDGHTFYGNVFGGGSGYDPYKPGKWHKRAGSVGGNTVVDITGGHILTSVYGGNEMTNVDSTATINMTGGTLGVPRTLGQIAAHPVTCYLFGAGKGDMRTFFNTETNVARAIINISDSARIYGSVFGGGEDGHVLGDITLNILAGDSIMVGDKKIQHPYIGTTGTSYVDGNVFGAGRGFNGEAITAGSVGGNVVTNITGGTMLGSIYGGGRLASVGIGFNAPTDSKYGQFTEDTISKGKTYGHITVNISGGTIGNDLEFIAPIPDNIPEGLPDSIDKWTDENWTTWKEHNRIPNTTFDKETRRPTHTKGGNVFGGSMGRLDKLDGTINPMWPQLGQTKTTNVNISGDNTVIKGNVYGGGELGTVRDSSIIVVGKESMTGTTITNPTIEHDIYGGGYGSSDARATSKASVESKDASNNTHLYTYTPIQWAGIVGIETHVNIYGGHVKRNVYGGGEMATVGIINYEVYNEGEHEGEYIYLTKHADPDDGFILSWPYELKYVPGYEGVTTVNIKGGRIGLSGKDYMGPWGSDNITPLNLDSLTNPIEEDNGDVYGGGKGIAGDRYSTIFCANVYATEVNIDLPTPEFDDIEILTKSEYEVGKVEAKMKYSLNLKNPANGISSGIAGSVYGGAENGHVIKDAKINIKGGYIGHGVYGGGKGKGTYETTLKKLGAASDDDTYTTQIYSITAGRVFGNTEINMSDGWVMRNIYGGGNMGSVGVGNYAGAADDYWDTGYGEKITGSLWTPSTSFNPNLPISTANIPVTNADYFLSSGKSKVTITGGTVGYLVNDKNKKKVSSKDDLPTGNVFGGCRGESAPNITESPRYQYCPAFFSGYVNETVVIIGDSSKIDDDSYTGPTIYGSVYGGGQDGHVRRDTKVTINKAVIGIPFNSDNQVIFKSDLDDLHWLHRGNVYGAGSGIGEYEYDFDYDGDYDSKTGNNSEAVSTTYHGNPIKEKDKSTSAGSVTRFTNVEINGGTIYRNVYGGGSLSSVGAPKIFQDYVLYRKGDTITGHGVGKQTLNEVIINGGTIGDTISRAVGYGGNVYGASRGEAGLGSGFANSVWTTVEANSGHIYGNVFGGGEAGTVTMDTKVILGGKVVNTNGAPRRAAPAAVQPNAAVPASNAGNAGNSSPSTPANVSTEAPDARSIRVNRANQ